VFPSVRHPKLSQAPALQTWVAGRLFFWSASDLAELWIAPERELVGAARRACSRAYVTQSCRKRQHSKLGLRGGCFFGVLPTWRSFGLRRSGNSLGGLRGRVPERASSKAVASASTPNLGCGAAVFLECFRHGGALDCAGAGTRGSGWEGVFPSVRHPKLSQAPALQTWVAGRLFFWSASDLAELWIAPERELVGAARRACSRAYVIQSCRKRQHSKLGWRGGCFFGVLPTWRSFGLRRSGNSWERLGGRVPEHTSSKAVASASTPNLGDGVAAIECQNAR